MSKILPYQLEPEYSSTEERNESEEEEEEEDDSPLANAGGTGDCRSHTSWCLYKQCTMMPTEVECVCCLELAYLSKMVKGKV